MVVIVVVVVVVMVVVVVIVVVVVVVVMVLSSYKCGVLGNSGVCSVNLGLNIHLSTWLLDTCSL